jgi:CHAT domain-containing protein
LPALVILSTDDPDRPTYTVNLGNVYWDRYLRLGEDADIDRAVRAHEQALSALSVGSDDRARCLNNLSLALRSRYERDGGIDDLERSVMAFDEATHGQPDIPDYPYLQQNLSTTLLIRFERVGDPQDLERAITVGEDLVTGTNPRAAERASFLHTLANALQARYQQDKDARVLDRVVTLREEAVAISAVDSPGLAAIIDNLGGAYLDRYERGGDPRDLDRALQAHEAAVQRTPPELPDLAAYLNNLGRALQAHYILVQDHDDLRRGIETYRQAAQRGLGSNVSEGLKAARGWADWDAQRGSWVEAVEAFGLAMRAVDDLFRRQLLRHHKEAWLRASVGLFAKAAYALARSGDVKGAAVALERGRALLLSEALEGDRARLDQLNAAGQGIIAERFRRSTEHLLALTQTAAQQFTARRAGELRAAQRELEAVIAEIRAVPGFERFFDQPSIDDILAAATDAPIVYLAATDLGGLALLVRGGQRPNVTLRWLDQLTETTLGQRVDRYFETQAMPNSHTMWPAMLSRTTRWLWDAVMEPVLEELAPASRAVMVPVGLLGLLPLHAAWTVEPATPTGRRYALDRCLLTYAPNARALAAAYALASETPASTALVVEEPRPVRASRLPNTHPEAEAASSSVGGVHRLRYGKATRRAVYKALENVSLAHFACHGHADLTEPLEGGLVMANDELLTLRDLLTLKLRARLVVLSACETGLPGAELPDEVVALPTGLLQAGAAGVVASLWSVIDKRTMLLMVRFYDCWRRRGDPSSRPAPAGGCSRRRRRPRERPSDGLRSTASKVLTRTGTSRPSSPVGSRAKMVRHSASPNLEATYAGESTAIIRSALDAARSISWRQPC